MKEGKQHLQLEYNSTYISINLIDELDYVIGGYGKATFPFVYTLNAFIESYILNGHFYISDQEARHFQLTSQPFFPNGRPMLDLLFNTGCFSIIGGIAQPIGKVVFLRELPAKTNESITAAIAEFQEKLTGEARENYLTLPADVAGRPVVKYLVLGGISNGIAITEHCNPPEEIVKKLNESLHHTNVQVTLPVYTYEFQIQELQNRGLSKEILWQLTQSFVKEQDKLRAYLGFSQQTIPPLVPILLSQCRTVADIPDKLVQLRADFGQLRECIRQFEQRTAEAATIKEQLEAMQELDRFWSVFNKKYKQPGTRLLYRFWDVAKESEYEKALDAGIDKGAADILENLNLGKMVGQGALKLLEWYRERKILNRFKGVTDIWELFRNGPNLCHQLKEMERVFDVTFTQAEIEQAMQHIAAIRNAQDVS